MQAGSPAALLRVFLATALPLLAAALLFGIAAAVSGDDQLRWIALHLALLGAVSQLIVGVGQFFICAYLATEPTDRRLVYAQSIVWNLAVLLVVLAVPTDLGGLAAAGSVLVIAGLALFLVGMESMQRRSLQRPRWAIRWYQLAAAFLAAGALIGAALALHEYWPHGSLLGAHIVLNVVGWLGTAIVGTLHTFFPTLSGTKLLLPRLQTATVWSWCPGVVVLALGALFASGEAVTLGLLILTLAALLLAANLIKSLRGRTIALSKPAIVIAAGQVFLVAACLAATGVALASGGATDLAELPLALPSVLAACWILLTVAGSLAHLIGVLLRVRRIQRSGGGFG